VIVFHEVRRLNTTAGRSFDVSSLFQQAVNIHLAGDLAGAEHLYRELLKRQPDHADALKNLGVIALSHGKPDSAIAFLVRAIALTPDDAAAYSNLGAVYRGKREYGRAVACYRHAIAIDPAFAEAWNNLGVALRRMKEPLEAEYAFRKALTLKGDYADALINLGILLRERGERGEAKTLMEQAVRLNPKSVAAHCHLFELQNGDSKHELFESLVAMRGLKLNLDDAVMLEATIGKAFDRTGDYDNAFECIRTSNELNKRRPLSIEPLRDQLHYMDELEELQENFFADRKGWGNPSEVPVFVVGMPRSGTTLTEQIIASHPEASGVGELHDIEEASRLVFVGDSGRGGARSLKDKASSIDASRASQLADSYLHSLFKHAGSRERVRIVDKNPFNFRYLWLISLMYPNARVVHCRRDPRDSCLSCYSQLQASFFNDLEELGRYYLAYDRLMRHWKRVLPTRMLELQYEELVSSPESQIRKLIDFVGLPWDQSCLHFHERKQSIQTPSAEQVRRGVYTSSVGRWKNYEPHLAPLIKALGVSTQPTESPIPECAA